MSGLVKWKKALFSILAIGIIGWSFYGVYHTINAFDNIQPSQSGGNALSSDSIFSPDSPVSGSFCNPLGCAVCRGCASLLYQQNIEALPSSDVQVEQID